MSVPPSPQLINLIGVFIGCLFLSFYGFYFLLFSNEVESFVLILHSELSKYIEINQKFCVIFQVDSVIRFIDHFLEVFIMLCNFNFNKNRKPYNLE